MDRVKNLETVALICGKDSYDKNIEFAYDYAESIIKNYCNVTEIPEELEKTLIDMACEMFRCCGYGEEGVGGVVKQLKEGDVSVSFGSADESSLLDIKKFEKQLMKFRRPMW